MMYKNLIMFNKFWEKNWKRWNLSKIIIFIIFIKAPREVLPRDTKKHLEKYNNKLISVFLSIIRNKDKVCFCSILNI